MASPQPIFLKNGLAIPGWACGLCQSVYHHERRADAVMCCRSGKCKECDAPTKSRGHMLCEEHETLRREEFEKKRLAKAVPAEPKEDDILFVDDHDDGFVYGPDAALDIARDILITNENRPHVIAWFGEPKKPVVDVGDLSEWLHDTLEITQELGTSEAIADFDELAEAVEKWNAKERSPLYWPEEKRYWIITRAMVFPEEE